MCSNCSYQLINKKNSSTTSENLKQFVTSNLLLLSEDSPKDLFEIISVSKWRSILEKLGLKLFVS